MSIFDPISCNTWPVPDWSATAKTKVSILGDLSLEYTILISGLRRVKGKWCVARQPDSTFMYSFNKSWGAVSY